MLNFEKGKHYSEELENSIIGVCLSSGALFARVYDLLKPEFFYIVSNEKIFSVVREMFEENLPIDIYTTADYLIRKKGITEFSGENTIYHLSTKTNFATSTATLEYNAAMVKEMWIDREVIKLQNAGIGDGSGRDKLADIESRIRELKTTSSVNDWMDMSELMASLYKHQDNMMKTEGQGLLTGFKTIDMYYGGFHNGQMIVLAARPSVGKSAFAGQIAINIAKAGKGVGFISLEMNNNEIAARLSALDTDFTFTEIFRSLYRDESDRKRFYDIVNKSTIGLPIYVSDKTDVNISDIKAKAYKLMHKKSIGCLVIDYLQLVEGEGGRNRENEVAKISRGFKIIAKELNVPLLVLAQLNREVDKRNGQNRFPQLSDLRESGAIEQDADAVMFLHSDYKSGVLQDENGETTEHSAHLVIRKWRNGVSNIFIELDFDGPKMKFTEKGDNPNYPQQGGSWRPI